MSLNNNGNNIVDNIVAWHATKHLQFSYLTFHPYVAISLIEVGGRVTQI